MKFARDSKGNLVCDKLASDLGSCYSIQQQKEYSVLNRGNESDPDPYFFYGCAIIFGDLVVLYDF